MMQHKHALLHKMRVAGGPIHARWGPAPLLRQLVVREFRSVVCFLCNTRTRAPLTVEAYFDSRAAYIAVSDG